MNTVGIWNVGLKPVCCSNGSGSVGLLDGKTIIKGKEGHRVSQCPPEKEKIVEKSAETLSDDIELF